MKSINETVIQIVERDALIESLAQQGLINVASYAKSIKPEVEMSMDSEVSNHSIQMALGRHFKKNSEATKRRRSSDVQVFNDLESVTFERCDETGSLLKMFYSATPKNGEIPTVFVHQGMTTVTITASNQVMDFLHHLANTRQDLPKTAEMTDLAAITLTIDQAENPSAELQDLVTRLTMRKIPIHDVVSSQTEVTIVLPQESAEEAIEALT